MGGDPWRKSDPERVAQFHDTVAGIEGLEVRKMFGYPAGFVGGYMAAGLHQDAFIVRLPEEEGAARLADGWEQFEPMPGRPMRGFVVLPEDVRDDPDEARRWTERAVAHVRTMPPKEPKPRKMRGATGATGGSRRRR